MRRPFDSLEDFTGKTGLRKPPDPPSAKYVEPLGTRQELEPLAIWEEPLKKSAAGRAFRRRLLTSFPKFAAFNRSMVAGATAMVAVVIGATFYFENRNGAMLPPSEPRQVTTVKEPEQLVQAPDDPDLSSLSTSDDPTFSYDDDQTSKRRERPRRLKQRVLFAAYHQRHVLPRPQFIVSDFIPTTLIIYVENGVVKTRIEPQLPTANAKPRPSSN